MIIADYFGVDLMYLLHYHGAEKLPDCTKTYSTAFIAIISLVDKGITAHEGIADAQRDPIVKPEHMPEAHRRYLQEYNAEEFESWGKSVGPKTSEVVHYFLTSGREVEQGYKSCASLKKLEKSYSAKCLEYACGRALTLSPVPTIRNINILIKSNPEKEPEKPAPVRDGKSHGFVRGAAYYSRGGQHNE